MAVGFLYGAPVGPQREEVVEIDGFFLVVVKEGIEKGGVGACCFGIDWTDSIKGDFICWDCCCAKGFCGEN